jgi:hypothetical protein
MPASRNSSSSASSLNPLGDLLAATCLRASISGEAPLSSRARSSTTVGAAAVAPPPTSRSLPASSAGAKRSTGGVHGHTKGKDSLFCYGSSKDGLICAGYVCGKDGARRRFCCKTLDAGVKHCGDKAHSAKFPMILEPYYIKM